jgi:hypothetical protein
MGSEQPSCLQAAGDSDQPASGGNVRKSFWVSLSTQLSNPKTAVAYGSIFAALLPQIRPCGVISPCRRWFLRSKPAGTQSSPYVFSENGRVAAGAIATLGLRLLFTAYRAGI